MSSNKDAKKFGAGIVTKAAAMTAAKPTFTIADAEGTPAQRDSGGHKYESVWFCKRS